MPADQLYSLYIREDVDHYVPESNCSALLKFKGAISLNAFYFRNLFIFKLCTESCDPPADLHTNTCCGQLESRKRNWCCVSVCLRNRQMRAVRAVIFHCTSDMSQCPSEGDRRQTTQETSFSIKLSPSPCWEELVFVRHCSVRD